MGLGGLSVGLATGINYGEIIESLLEIEQRPVQQLQEKINLNSIKQEAYDELNTLALSARLSMFDLSQNSTFEQKNATSSDENVLTATATSAASVGTHQLRVSQLATASVTLSSGFQDRDTTTLGAGSMSFELGSKRLDKGTNLDDLNDGAGIDRGVIRLTNTNGTTESFDMASAVTVQDALDILNGNTMGLNFTTDRSIVQSSAAREINGYSIQVTNSGTQNVTLSDLGTSTTLNDLGFSSSASKTVLANSTSNSADQIFYITEASNLSQINDGLGIQTNSSGTNDIRFYIQNTITQSFKSVEVDLSNANTVGDVVDEFNTAIASANLDSYSQVSLSSDGVSLEFTGVVADFTNINNSKAASDLGLTKIENVGGSYKGEALLAEMNGTLIRNLHGGNGIRNLETGVFSISSRRGDTYLINLDQAVSIQDINRLINEAEAVGQSTQSIVAGTGGGQLSVSSGTLSDSIFASGGRSFETDRLVGATITVSTGGTDYTATISAYDAAAGSFTLANDNITGTAAETNIDNVGVGYTITYETIKDISAKVSDGGSNLEIMDDSSGDSTFRIDDLNGDVASQLGIESTIANTPVLFNPIDLTNDPDGSSRTSSIYLAKSSLPQDINKDQMIGRSIEHVWSSRTSNSGGSGESTIETAKIVAFEEAGEDLYISDIDAAASATITIASADTVAEYSYTNEDTIVDQTNLASANVDEDLIVGATFKIFTTNGEFSSTIIDYDSGTQSVTLLNNEIFTELTNVGGGGNETATLISLGYTIEYNHKVSLKYDAVPTTVPSTETDAGATYNMGANTYTDTMSIDSSSTVVDYDNLEGATITAYNPETNIEYSAVISSVAGNTVTFLPDSDEITNTFETVAYTASATYPTLDSLFQNAGYYITYSPIQNGKRSSLNYLTDLSQANPAVVDETDYISIVGVGSNESVNGGNLENRIMSSFTRLDDLNGGNGIVRGQFSITNGDSTNSTTTIFDLDDDSIQTIQDVIDEIKSNLANLEVEINDRGDGLRIYDMSSSQNSAVTITDVNGSGTAASLNLLSNDFSRYQVQVSPTAGTNFSSLSGTAAQPGGAGASTIEVAEFVGLNREDVIGSKITYTDTTVAGQPLLVHAVVIDYVDSNNTATLTLAGRTTEDGNPGAIANWNAAGETVNLHLKEHQNDFERLGTIDQSSVVNAGTGEITFDLSAALTNIEVEELVGSIITLTTSEPGSNVDNYKESIGITAMITDFDGTDEVTIISADENVTELINFTNSNDVYVNISKDFAPLNHVQAGDITTTNSFLRNVTGSGFISITADVEAGGSTNTIISDQFANLDPSKVIGSLITISQHTADPTKEGNVAIVTGYNALANAITIDNFYDNAGAVDALALDDTDEVYLTYADEFEGVVLRSEAPTSITITNEIDATLTNNRYVQIDNILALAGQSEEALIGSTITFNTGTGTTALEGESRTIVDIIHDYGGNTGETVVVLDEELTAAPDATDDFTLTFTEITATIDKIDFATGVISTRDKMQAAMGDRSFNIHPVVDGTYQKEIEIFGTDTLDDVVDKINAADVGVDASVINDGSGSNPFRLSLISSNTGELGAVNVGTSLQNIDLTIATQAQDAKVILGDPSGSSSVLSSSNNILTEAIAGVTLNLVSTNSDPVTVTIDYDREGITETVTTVVDEVNALLEAANSLIALETEVEITNDDGSVSTETQKGVLFGDVATRTMINDIKFLLTSIVDNVPTGSINSYSEIGITLNSAGDTFEFDETILQNMLNVNFTQVQDLFTFTPNLLGNAGVTVSSSFLQDGYDINSTRNGITSGSGFSETGNGSNGVKLLAGDTSKYITYTLGEEKDLYGFRFHHHVPTDLTARYNVAQANAGGAVLATAGGGTSTLTDATYLGASVEFIEEQLIGATLTINDPAYTATKSATITAYDSTTGELTLDADLTAILSPGLLDPTQGYTITTPSGGNLDFSHKPIVEYLDRLTGDWKVYQAFNQIDDGKFSVVFPGGLRTESIRISYDDNNGESEDFTKNGYFARLMEFEVLEAQGLAAQFSRTFDGFTDANTGSLQFATESLSSQNEIYTAQIERLGESILNKQDQLIRQFQNLELVVSNLNNQSSFFQSQVNSLPTAFSYRGNNG